MGSRAPIILAVDDNPDALALLRLLLRREGFAVITATSGSEAV
jgi:CheY-like chemotaxis protein